MKYVIKKIISIVALLSVLFVFANNVIFIHTHILPDGGIIIHAHPLPLNSKNQAPYPAKNHTHTPDEYLFFTQIFNLLRITLIGLFIFIIFIISNFCPISYFSIKLYNSVNYGVKSPRSPPLLFHTF